MATPGKRIALLFTALLAAALLGLFSVLKASLPVLDDTVHVQELSAPVQVYFDKFGIPRIQAQTRDDAFRALGFVTARDRLFQMDLLRRLSAGRLAEIVGRTAVKTDSLHRVLGLEQAAAAIASSLPPGQKKALQAYADGVNSFLRRDQTLPFEFLVLGYEPRPWTVEDSLLVVLGMFETLTFTESQERMMSVMQATLPAEVVAFLTPDSDPYTEALLGRADSRRPPGPVPVEALAALLDASSGAGARASLVRAEQRRIGSNAWAVAASKTSDGRAILANDMHLDITVPNIWYQCHLRFGNVDIGGVALPGTPLFIAGATDHLAWGLTNLLADVLDLVRIDINPHDPKEYRTLSGWERFGTRREILKIKGERDLELQVRTTIWGPIASEPLMGAPVAMRWSALDPQAVNVGLLDMDQAMTLEQGMAIMNRTGGPPTNAILAERTGRIAWTTMGRIPVRRGFDGVVSRSWADGSVGWSGYIKAGQLPRRLDPSTGFVVSANNRPVGKEYPYLIGHGFENGYRAWRIAQRLQALNAITEQHMLRLQLDTRSEFYQFYRDLALQVLTPQAIEAEPARAQLRDELLAWKGDAEIESRGVGLLIEFRERLAESVLTPFLAACRRHDKNFEYRWDRLDNPLQAILTGKHPKLLRASEHYSDWNAFILVKLEESARALRRRHRVDRLGALHWGRLNSPKFSHPLSEGILGLGGFLDMPADPLPGCSYCVRYAYASGGASERLVISPGHPEAGILHMPGGQSGHPLSPHYRDQHPYWVQGEPLPFVSNESLHTLRLERMR